MSKRAAPTKANHRLPEKRIQDLLDVAAEVFFEHGFEAASVGEMARRAKASKGTYYSRYPTKEKLFEEVVKRRSDAILSEFRGSLSPERAPAETLTAFGRDLLARILSPEIVALERIIYMDSMHFPALGRIFCEAGPWRIVEKLTDYFHQLNQRGVLKIEHARIAAEQFVDAVGGTIMRESILGLPEKSLQERKQRVQMAVDLFLRAYAVRKP